MFSHWVPSERGLGAKKVLVSNITLIEKLTKLWRAIVHVAPAQIDDMKTSRDSLVGLRFFGPDKP